MEYLNQAELYAESQGDLQKFKDIYSDLRESKSVVESVWQTMSYLYDPYVADMFELNYYPEELQ